MADGSRRNRGGGSGGGARPGSRRSRSRRGRSSGVRAATGATTPVESTHVHAEASAVGDVAGSAERPSGAPRPEPRRGGPTLGSRLRRFGLTMAGIDGAAVLLLVIGAVLGTTLRGVGWAPMPSAVATLWMTLNLGSVTLQGVTLGMLPALPAMLFAAWGAWRIRREVSGPVSVRDVRVLAAFTVLTPAVLTVLAWLVLSEASARMELAAPPLAPAIASSVVIHVVMLAWGLGPKLLTALLRRRAWPEWPLTSARLAVSIVGWLWVAGLLVSLVAMAVSWRSVADLWARTGEISGTAGQVGSVVVSALYLPNIAVAAAGILVGAPANLGAAVVDLFHVDPGTVPPLPVMAAMPQSYWSPVVMGLFILPVAVVVWRTWRFLRREETPNPYATVVVAAGVAAVLMGLLAWLTSGLVGWYGQSGLAWGETALLTSIWVAAPAAIMVIVVAWADARAAAAEKERAAREAAEAAAAAEAARKRDDAPGDAAADGAADAADEADEADDADAADEADLADGADDADAADEADEAGEADAAGGADEADEADEADKADDADLADDADEADAGDEADEADAIDAADAAGEADAPGAAAEEPAAGEGPVVTHDAGDPADAADEPPAAPRGDAVPLTRGDLDGDRGGDAG
ncbi:cell division protein PerM [Corynebacterium sp. 335C]